MIWNHSSSTNEGRYLLTNMGNAKWLNSFVTWLWSTTQTILIVKLFYRQNNLYVHLKEQVAQSLAIKFKLVLKIGTCEECNILN